MNTNTRSGFSSITDSKFMLKASPTFGIDAVSGGKVTKSWVPTILFSSPILNKISTAAESKATILCGGSVN